MYVWEIPPVPVLHEEEVVLTTTHDVWHRYVCVYIYIYEYTFMRNSISPSPPWGRNRTCHDARCLAYICVYMNIYIHIYIYIYIYEYMFMRILPVPVLHEEGAVLATTRDVLRAPEVEVHGVTVILHQPRCAGCQKITCHIGWNRKRIIWFSTLKVEFYDVTVALFQGRCVECKEMSKEIACDLVEDHCDAAYLNFVCRESEHTLMISPNITRDFFTHDVLYSVRSWVCVMIPYTRSWDTRCHSDPRQGALCRVSENRVSCVVGSQVYILIPYTQIWVLRCHSHPRPGALCRCQKIACHSRGHKCVFWFPTLKVEIHGVTVILHQVRCVGCQKIVWKSYVESRMSYWVRSKCMFWFPTRKVEVRRVTVVLDEALGCQKRREKVTKWHVILGEV